MQHCNESINSPSSQSTNIRLLVNQSKCVCVKILSILKKKKSICESSHQLKTKVEKYFLGVLLIQKVRNFLIYLYRYQITTLIHYYKILIKNN